jgi:hypothetical protein
MVKSRGALLEHLDLLDDSDLGQVFLGGRKSLIQHIVLSSQLGVF